MTKSKFNPTTTLAVALSLSLAFLTAPVSAEKKGPRASLSVATTCALNGTNFDVTVNVRDKTSGDADAVVDFYSITPVYKNRANRGNTTTPIDDLGLSSDTNTPVNSGLTITQTFPLCDSLGDLPSDLRSINAEVSVSYGKDDGAGGIADTRTIMNRCSDDPETEDVIEPAGIKVNYDELATACVD